MEILEMKNLITEVKISLGGFSRAEWAEQKKSQRIPEDYFLLIYLNIMKKKKRCKKLNRATVCYPFPSTLKFVSQVSQKARKVWCRQVLQEILYENFFNLKT